MAESLASLMEGFLAFVQRILAEPNGVAFPRSAVAARAALVAVAEGGAEAAVAPSSI